MNDGTKNKPKTVVLAAILTLAMVIAILKAAFPIENLASAHGAPTTLSVLPVKPQNPGKSMAAGRSGSLPIGIARENVVLWGTNSPFFGEEEKRKADDVGQTFSPIGRKCGMFGKDAFFLAMLNTSLKPMVGNPMQAMKLIIPSQIKQQIAASMADMYVYIHEIILIAAIVVIILVAVILNNVRVSRQLKEQNKKYEVLSQISNEYIFEYHVKNQKLKLSDHFRNLFSTPESIAQVTNLLKQALLDQKTDWSNQIIQLHLPDGQTGYFKAVNTHICNRRGNTDYIIGKLVDVSEEVLEKEALLVKAQTDGLTGLYNATTTKDFIEERIQKKKPQALDAFILMDCDSFKGINDTEGHFVGNQVLEEIATCLRQTFRNTDILGRIGGDEFCVYVKDIPSVDFVREKCMHLNDQIGKIGATDGRVNVSLSIGIALVTSPEPYCKVFKKADDALYQAKGEGKSRVVVWGEEIHHSKEP